MNHPEKFITTALIVLFAITATSSFAQIKLNCCGIIQTIPHFKDDSIFTPISDDLEKAKIIEPINQSDADVEIRIYDISYVSLRQKLTVIKCVRDSFSIVKYTYTRGLLVSPNGESVKISNDDNSPLTKEVINKIAGRGAISAFFKALIDNHLFDMPGEDELAKIIEKNHPGTREIWEGSVTFELKAGTHYRSFYYKSNYFPEPADLDLYIHQQNIMQLLRF